MPAILLGGIYSGVVTPTEAAAVAAAYAFGVAVFWYRNVSVNDTYTAVLNSARSTASIGMLIAGGAGIFAALFSGTAALATLGVSVALAMLAGIIVSVPVYMALWFAAPLVLFDGMAPGAALKASFSACLKNVIAFTLYAIVLAVLFVAGSIPFGLGLIVVLPVTLISVYTAYREIFFGV